MTVANGEFHVFLKRTEYSDKCIASFKMIYNVLIHHTVDVNFNLHTQII